MVAAAIVGGAVVGVAGSAIAGSEAGSATKSAANTAANVQEDALAQEKALAKPYTDLGTSGMANYEKLLGIGGGGAAGIEDALKATPGYQFTQQQGETGILNAASASGGVSGNTLTALDRYNTGLVDSTYETALNNALQPIQIGQASAAGTAANIQTGASNIGSIATNEGNNLANIDIGTAAGISNAIGNASNNYTEQQTIGALLAAGGGGGLGGVSLGGDGTSDGYRVN
jgi:hypothetical protein